MEAVNLIYEIEDQCEFFAKEIRQKFCKSIIDSLNKNMTGIEGDDYDALGMSYFDKLSIKYQSCSLEEISDGFEEHINDMIDIEYDNLTAQERFFMDYCNCSEQMHINIEASKTKVLQTLCKFIDEHYYSEEVQRYVDILNGYGKAVD